MHDSTFPAEQELPLLRKSRSGCRDCKLRKVKCDEIKPVCSNCRRRYAKIQRCDWDAKPPAINGRNIRRHPLRQPSRLAAVPGRTADIPLPDLTLHPFSAADENPWRTVELRLMHHYTAVVCHSMPDPDGAPARDMWQRIIPQLAFDSEVVLNPMLALSALHFHVHSPNDPGMTISLRRYLGRTLMNRRQALLGPHHGVLSEHIWLSAVILAIMYWLLARQRQPGETYALPFEAWNMTQGVCVIYSQNNTLLKRLGYSWFEQVWCGHDIQPLVVADDQLSAATQTQLQCVKRDLEHLLVAFGVTALPEAEREIYLEAKNYVLHYYRAFYFGVTAGFITHFIKTMPLKCQPGYRTMLERHDPLAMALMARMLVLSCGLEPVWWMNGGEDYEVLRWHLRGICELMPTELRWVVDWPCDVLNGKIMLNRER